MKWPSLFRRQDASLMRENAQEQTEKLLAESFRMLSQVCLKMAQVVESQRLSRQGYHAPGKFLERLDGEDNPPKAP